MPNNDRGRIFGYLMLDLYSYIKLYYVNEEKIQTTTKKQREEI